MISIQGPITKKATLLDRITEPRRQIPEERKRFSNAALKDLILPIIIEQFLALLVLVRWHIGKRKGFEVI